MSDEPRSTSDGSAVTTSCLVMGALGLVVSVLGFIRTIADAVSTHSDVMPGSPGVSAGDLFRTFYWRGMWPALAFSIGALALAAIALRKGVRFKGPLLIGSLLAVANAAFILVLYFLPTDVMAQQGWLIYRFIGDYLGLVVLLLALGAVAGVSIWMVVRHLRGHDVLQVGG